METSTLAGFDEPSEIIVLEISNLRGVRDFEGLLRVGVGVAGSDLSETAEGVEASGPTDTSGGVDGLAGTVLFVRSEAFTFSEIGGFELKSY